MSRWPLWLWAAQWGCGLFFGIFAIIFLSAASSGWRLDGNVKFVVGVLAPFFASGFVGMLLGDGLRRGPVSRQLLIVVGIAAGLAIVTFVGCWGLNQFIELLERAGFVLNGKGRPRSPTWIEEYLAALWQVCFVGFIIFCVGLASPLSAWLATRGEVKKVECEGLGLWPMWGDWWGGGQPGCNGRVEPITRPRASSRPFPALRHDVVTFC